MLNNYTRTAWRSLLKNRIFTLINVFGLAAGIAAFLFIISYVRFERSYEAFNPNADNVWRITYDIYNGSEYVETDCETHAPMGNIIKSRFPEVVDYVRMYNTDGVVEVKVDDRKFVETGSCYADTSVYRILAMNLIRGDQAKSLTDPYSIVLSRSEAIKFFGNIDVVGESLKLDNMLFRVTGVFEDQTQNTHLKFKMLMSHSTLHKIWDWYTDETWNGNNEYTYLSMKPGTDVAAFNEKLSVLSKELKEKINKGKYSAQPIKEIHLYSHKSFEPEANGNAKIVNVLAIVALFIIVIAWVNYMNLATARAVERAREVGVRKVMGSMKIQLVIQFLAESLIVNIIAGVIAIALVQMTMPLFRELSGVPSLNIDNAMWMLLAGLVSIGSIMAGIYPAFVLSSFRPVVVLKGKFQSSSHGQLLRKSLVVFQFATTIILIIGVSTVYRQVNYLRSTDLGARLDHTLAVRIPEMEATDSVFSARYSHFKTEALGDPSVKSLSVSQALPGIPKTEMSTSRFALMNKQEEGRYNYYWYMVDEDFTETMNIKMTAGRDFESKSDIGNAMVNETAARLLGFEKPEDALGAQFTFIDWRTLKPATIVGVVKNFYQVSPKEEHIPMVFIYNDRGRYATARFEGNDPSASIATLRRVWNDVFPGEPFNYFFVDEQFNRQYRADIQFGQVMGTFSVLAVIIACLGLFGLSSYTILQRRKEIGIRKVLGATIAQVVTLLSGGYLRIMLISSVLALPIAWFAIDNWLSGYTIRIDMTVSMFVIPIILILVVALTTVSFQTVRSALVNPAKSLKEE